MSRSTANFCPLKCYILNNITFKGCEENLNSQRVRLAKYLNSVQRFRGTFSEIRHDKQNCPEMLLLDVYPIYSNGKKVPLRSKPYLTNKRGMQIACDHVWTKLNQNILRLSTELIYGDEIDFDATVTQYPITRNNTINKRDEIWQIGQKKREDVYRDYRQFRDTVLEAQYQAGKEAIQKAYDAYKQHLITFSEMQKAQKSIQRELKASQHKAYRSMRQKQQRRIARAQQQIADVKMVDYGLSNLQNVSYYKNSGHMNLRGKYDANRLSDLRYTKFLAWHSMHNKEILIGSE